MPLSKSEYNSTYRKLDTLVKTTEKAMHDNDALLAQIEISNDFETDEDLQELHSDSMADKTAAYADIHEHLTGTVKPFLMGLKPVAVKAKAATTTITPTVTPITPTPPITPPGPTPCARPCIVRAKPSIVRHS